MMDVYILFMGQCSYINNDMRALINFSELDQKLF